MDCLRITKGNREKEHICCAMSGKRSLVKRPRQNTWTKRQRTIKPFWQVLPPDDTNPKTGRRRTGPSIESGLATVNKSEFGERIINDKGKTYDY